MDKQDKYGVTFSTPAKEVLIETPQTLSSYVIPKSCIKISGGSVKNSAFYPCRNSIKTISFEKESKFATIDSYVFSKTTISTIDFTNCNDLRTISPHCFASCFSLQSITLPPNIQTLGEYSFHDSYLTTITFPKSLKSVHNSAFRFSKIRTVSIPDDTDMAYIGAEAFANSKLEGSFYIGEFVTNIMSGAFHSSSINEFRIHTNNIKYEVDFNCLIENKNTLKIPILTYTGTIDIPSTITKIECFRGAKCTKVTIPPSVFSITNWCFNGCNLESIDWPVSIPNIPGSCFYNCKKLKNITLPEGTKSIGIDAFYNCAALKYIEIPESLETIGSGAFTSCKITVNASKNKNIEINDGMLFVDLKTTLIDYFGSNATVTLPPYCTVVGASVFAEKPVTSVIFQTTERLVLKDKCFQNSNLTKIEFPSCEISIGEYCFDGSTKLVSVTFNSGRISCIPLRAFFNCRRLTSFEVPTTLEYINESAFAYCTSLTSFIIPESVMYIGPYCFRESGIEEISINSQTIWIEYDAFMQCKVQTLTITTPSFTFVPKEMCYKCSQLSGLSLPDSVCEIDNEAFAYCTSLYSITLPKNIELLKTRAFYGCSSLANVIFPKDSNIEEFNEQVFGNCMKLETLVIDPNDTKLYFDQYTLMNKAKTNILLYLPSSQNNVFITPESVERISAFAFCNCISLKYVVIPEGRMKYIGISAFKGCKKLSFLNLPKCIETIAFDGFRGCKSLKCGSVNAPLSIHEQAKIAGIPEIAFQKQCSKESCRVINKIQRANSATTVFITFITANSS